jgi:threonine/homoserine/homoserine lactone efflux protein
LHRIFRDGFIVALLNPKTAVFFAAFLPQFMDPGRSPMAQGVALGAMFVAIAAVTDTAYALAASSVAPAVGRAGRLRSSGRYLAGVTYIGLALLTAWGGHRSDG